jgi:hypothetical protein
MKTSKLLATLGLGLTLVGCSDKNHVFTNTIEQRGISPARPVELVTREYFFSNTGKTTKLDHALVFENGSAYRLEGESLQGLYQEAKIAESKNEETLTQWDNEYRHFKPFWKGAPIGSSSEK